MINSPLHIIADNIISPLGFDTEDNFQQIVEGKSSVRLHHEKTLYTHPVWVSRIDPDKLAEACAQEKLDINLYTKIEQMFILSIKKVLNRLDIDLKQERTALILATTKGNVHLINQAHTLPKDRVHISVMANAIGKYFDSFHPPIVVCNACISGVLALDVARRLIQSGKYDHIVVSGGDMLSEFVISGFQSFKAMSDEPCRPFDALRKGINLGEGAGTMVLSKSPATKSQIILEGTASSNDANHISGPSRNGEGLILAIQKAMRSARKTSDDIDYLSMHGTATIYNDEMEAKAINQCALNQIPMNSLKGYYGHTLGAAGMIESIIACRAIQKNMLIQSLGFERSGVSCEVSMISKTHPKSINRCLKSSSGFGGCNAVAIFSKNNCN